jgi:hypothetical protein
MTSTSSCAGSEHPTVEPWSNCSAHHQTNHFHIIIMYAPSPSPGDSLHSSPDYVPSYIFSGGENPSNGSGGRSGREVGTHHHSHYAVHPSNAPSSGGRAGSAIASGSGSAFNTPRSSATEYFQSRHGALFDEDSTGKTSGSGGRAGARSGGGRDVSTAKSFLGTPLQHQRLGVAGGDGLQRTTSRFSVAGDAATHGDVIPATASLYDILSPAAKSTLRVRLWCVPVLWFSVQWLVGHALLLDLCSLELFGTRETLLFHTPPAFVLDDCLGNSRVLVVGPP